MRPELTLAIDVGTGSARAALMNADGAIVAVAARELTQTVRQFGWSEQQPLAWWSGVVASVHDLLAPGPGCQGPHRQGAGLRADARHGAARCRWRTDPRHRAALE